jgi:hypothetical protein
VAFESGEASDLSDDEIVWSEAQTFSECGIRGAMEEWLKAKSA